MYTTQKSKLIYPDNIRRIISTTRGDGATGQFCFGTEQRPFSGKQCWIYVLNLEDGSTWAIRVPIHTSHLPYESITGIIEEEIQILKSLSESCFSMSPKLISFDSGFENAINYPYIILDWIHGQPLNWTVTRPSSRLQRDRLIHQIMDVTLDLATCTLQGVLYVTFRVKFTKYKRKQHLSV